MKFFLAILLFGAILSGATVDFRGGVILNAEMSKVAPQMELKNPPELPRDRLYAALTVRCDAGRKLSIYDYGIVSFGRVWPVVALKCSDDGLFTDNPDGTAAAVEPFRKYTLLFILDAKLFGLNGNEKLTLKANFPPPERAEQAVWFRHRGDDEFTPTAQIPAAGLMPEKL